ASRVGYPVVLKVISPEASHKSDVGGVELNLADAAAVRAAFGRIRGNLAERAPAAKFEGVAVQEMARPGIELIAGISRDERFGPLVMIGLGGVHAEVIKDTAVRLAPIGHREGAEMIAELRGAPILHGVRGRPGGDIGAIISVLAAISGFAAVHPEVAEMDLNPIVAYPDGIAILDARIVLAPPGQMERAAADSNHAARLENLKRAFNPHTVAVIGDKRAQGYLWIRAMSGFKGKLYSIQIDPAEIPGIEAMGVENRKSIAEIGVPIDYAVSAVPRNIAPRILKDCAVAKVGALSFFTSGFSETGDDTGTRLEADMRSIALDSALALVGPNCMGLYNPAAGIRNFPDEPLGDGGNVCFISQSGTHTINFCMQAPLHGIKINKAASIGNALMLDAADYIDLMSADSATRAIGLYIEGMRDGRRFFGSLRRAAERHPVAIWKGGATDAGARAAQSHTGALATPIAAWRAMVRQSGAVEVASLDAMLDAMGLFARTGRIRGRKMGLVAMTGGQSVAVTDAFTAAGLEIPALSEDSYAELKTFFNVIGGSYRNPLDAGGTIGSGVTHGHLDRILEILDRDSGIDAIVIELGSGLRASFWAAQEAMLAELLNKLATFAGRSQKPFAAVIQPAHLETAVIRAREMARERGIVAFDSFERAAAAFRAAADYWENRARMGG
ncbi:MAG TPA: acetate--CoA ligase family protein, partial [Candidatus Binataceae bacterium]|nr:acetate--CoA ligase family protein [Candidatus Binataceae bacterium]